VAAKTVRAESSRGQKIFPMVGNFSLYDCHGERQHTLYLGEAPEYGKACFKESLFLVILLLK
jgi:hypothetical protein